MYPTTRIRKVCSYNIIVLSSSISHWWVLVSLSLKVVIILKRRMCNYILCYCVKNRVSSWTFWVKKKLRFLKFSRGECHAGDFQWFWTFPDSVSSQRAGIHELTAWLIIDLSGIVIPGLLRHLFTKSSCFDNSVRIIKSSNSRSNIQIVEHISVNDCICRIHGVDFET